MAALVLGAAYGAITSLVNDVSSLYGMIGHHVADTPLAWAAQITSRLIGVGWAWAGLAMVAGWLARSGARAALVGALTLFAATAAYYGLDTVLREVPLAQYWPELRLWWIASVVLGPVLGVVGAAIRRPGVAGLLAGLTLPVGAVLGTTLDWLSNSIVTPFVTWPRMIVWVAATVGAGFVITRFLTAKRREQDTAVSSGASPDESMSGYDNASGAAS